MLISLITVITVSKHHRVQDKYTQFLSIYKSLKNEKYLKIMSTPPHSFRQCRLKESLKESFRLF